MAHGIVRWATTAALFYSFFVWGINYLTGGPTLMDLRRAINVTEAQMGFGFTVTSASNALGALLSGLLYAIFTRHIALSMSMISMGIASIYLALIKRYECFLGLVSVLGLSSGVMATGCNVWILEIWGNNQVMIQAMHFWYGVGASIGPLIAEPFLIPENETSVNWFRPEESLMLDQYDSEATVFGNSSVPSGGGGDDPEISNLLFIPYTISGIMCILSGLTFLALYIHILKKRLTAYRRRARVTRRHSRTSRRSAGNRSTSRRRSASGGQTGVIRNSVNGNESDRDGSDDDPFLGSGPADGVDSDGAGNETDNEAEDSSELDAKKKHKRLRSVVGHHAHHQGHNHDRDHTHHDRRLGNEEGEGEDDDEAQLLPARSSTYPNLSPPPVPESDVDLLSASLDPEQQPRHMAPGVRSGPPSNVVLAYVLIGSLLFTVDGFIELANFNYVSVFTATELKFSKVASDRISSAMAMGYTVGRAAGIVLALRMTSYSMLVLDGVIMLAASLLLYLFHESSTRVVWIGFILLGFGFASICPTIFACVRRRIPVTDLVGSILVFTPFLGAATGPMVIEHFSTHESANILLYLNVVCSVAFCAIIPFIKICDRLFDIDLDSGLSSDAEGGEGVPIEGHPDRHPHQQHSSPHAHRPHPVRNLHCPPPPQLIVGTRNSYNDDDEPLIINH